MPDVSIAISAQDSYSSAIKSMAQITKSFSKDMDEMEGKLSQLNKNRYSLKMDLREAQKKLSDDPAAARMAEQYQDGLVGGGQEYGHQGSQSDNAAGIQVRRCYGETALGNAAKDGSHQRACLAHFSQGTIHKVIGIMLQRLQKQKGGQQKRHGLRGIQKRVQDCIQYHFYTSFYRNVLSKPSLYDKKFLSQE